MISPYGPLKDGCATVSDIVMIDLDKADAFDHDKLYDYRGPQGTLGVITAR